MLAAQVDNGEVHVREVPDPVPAANEAVVKMTAAGVCHSDLHIARSDWFDMPMAIPIGHEGIGVVEALGPGADQFVAVGDRVILGLGGAGGGYWCGACRYCQIGYPRHCTQTRPLIGTLGEYL
jgi:D-arabinose 1-dehydrogenase-like Zn-dependent alcohol dehydrogenase